MAAIASSSVISASACMGSLALARPTVGTTASNGGALSQRGAGAIGSPTIRHLSKHRQPSQIALAKAGLPPSDSAKSGPERDGIWTHALLRITQAKNEAAERPVPAVEIDAAWSAEKVLTKWITSVALALVMGSSTAFMLAPPEANALSLASFAEVPKQIVVAGAKSDLLTLTKVFAPLDGLLSDQLKHISRSWFLADVNKTFPTNLTTREVRKTIVIDPDNKFKGKGEATGGVYVNPNDANLKGSTYDGKMMRFVPIGLGDGGSGEKQKPVFLLADGVTLQNVVIGAPGADGIHCFGTCTLKNVYWENIGEDAATQKGKNPSQVMTIDGGIARSSDDKVFQSNGPGKMVIKNFYATDIGKLYRSCGNCKTSYQRSVEVDNVTVDKVGKGVLGINSEYPDRNVGGDTAKVNNLTITNTKDEANRVCITYRAAKKGSEPSESNLSPSAKAAICKTSNVQTK